MSVGYLSELRGAVIHHVASNQPGNLEAEEEARLLLLYCVDHTGDRQLSQLATRQLQQRVFSSVPGLFILHHSN